MKVGGSQRIEVILVLPSASPSVSPEKKDAGYTTTPFKTSAGRDISVVSAPPSETQFTLHVQAPAFDPDSYTLQPTVNEDEVRWDFVISPKADHIGEQRIGLRIDQSIPGVYIKPELQSQELDDVVITVEAVGGSAAVSTNGFASLAVWVLPAIIIPLIPVTVALIGRENIIGWYRRTFRRKRPRDDDEVIP